MNKSAPWTPRESQYLTLDLLIFLPLDLLPALQTFLLTAMPDVPINYDNLASIAATHDPTAPIYVLNLWKYRTTASYAPEHAHLAGRPCTGYEAGVRYRTALRPLVPPNTSAFLVAKVLTGVAVPEDEDWDDVFILRYV